MADGVKTAVREAVEAAAENGALDLQADLFQGRELCPSAAAAGREEGAAGRDGNPSGGAWRDGNAANAGRNGNAPNGAGRNWNAGTVATAEDGEVEEAGDDEVKAEALNLRGRGRPKGAKNKKSAALREYIAARYGNPVCLLMARAVADVRSLAAELGAEPLDVWKEQNDILKSVLPFVMEKMTPDQVQQNLISLSVSTAVFDAADEKNETMEMADFRQISAREIDND